MSDTTPVARTSAQLDLPEPAIPLEKMNSACPVPGFTAADRAAADRADPFWHGMWGDGSQSSWTSRALMERLVKSGLARPRATDVARSPIQAVEAITDRGNRQRHLSANRATRLAALAVAGMWRTVSAQQLAAFTGSASAASAALMLPVFQAGLADRGSLLSELPAAARQKLNHLYRPVESAMFTELLDRLSFGEVQALTAGVGWSRGPQHDRHNILAAELGLRVAEYLDIAAVLGESVCRMDLMAGQDLSADNRRSDLVIVRPDGHRIAVELTSSVGGMFDKKVARWAETLQSTDPADTGLSVVFLDAAVPDRSERLRRDVWTRMRACVGRAAYATPGAMRAQVPERMACARWSWWFPSALSAAPAFTTLRAQRPTGPHTDRWQDVHLLDSFDLEFNPRDPASGQALIDNARGLWGSPSWLRDQTPPDMSQTVMRRAGLDGPIRLPSTQDYRDARTRDSPGAGPVGQDPAADSIDDWMSD